MWQRPVVIGVIACLSFVTAVGAGEGKFRIETKIVYGKAGDLDLSGLDQLIDWYVERGVDGGARVDVGQRATGRQCEQQIGQRLGRVERVDFEAGSEPVGDQDLANEAGQVAQNEGGHDHAGIAGQLTLGWSHGWIIRGAPDDAGSVNGESPGRRPRLSQGGEEELCPSEEYNI
mgnify:CR=1 FL=1